MDKVELKSQKRLLQDFFAVDEQQFENSTGEKFKRLRVVTKPAAAILLYKKAEDKIIFGRQLRTPFVGTDVDPYFLEIPAGIIDDGEDAETSIKRESREETGYDVKNVEKITTIFSSPGYTCESLHIFYGEVSDQDRTEDGGGVDAHEEIEIIELDRKKAMEMLDSGELADAKSIIALLWLDRKLREGIGQ